MNVSDDFPMMMEREASHVDGLGRSIVIADNCPPVCVAFGMYPMKDGKRSQEAGYDVYKDVEHVRITVPGDRNSLYFQPATPLHRLRFPKAYAAYVARDVKPTEGFPLEEWAPVSRSILLNLKTMHINTVEALAAVHDGHIDRIGANGRELRAKAIAWLADRTSGAEAMKLAKANQDLQDQLSAMQAQINALSAAGVTSGAAGEAVDDGASARRQRARA